MANYWWESRELLNKIVQAIRAADPEALGREPNSMAMMDAERLIREFHQTSIAEYKAGLERLEEMREFIRVHYHWPGARSSAVDYLQSQRDWSVEQCEKFIGEALAKNDE